LLINKTECKWSVNYRRVYSGEPGAFEAWGRERAIARWWMEGTDSICACDDYVIVTPQSTMGYTSIASVSR